MCGHYTEQRPISPKGEQHLAQDLNPGLNLGAPLGAKRRPSPLLPVSVFRVLRSTLAPLRLLHRFLFLVPKPHGFAPR
ncbi:MAG: hypothetical protein QOH31_3236 [Verrucomicrobiota bacterium]|jgi:hypothetical protein